MFHHLLFWKRLYKIGVKFSKFWQNFPGKPSESGEFCFVLFFTEVLKLSVEFS